MLSNETKKRKLDMKKYENQRNRENGGVKWQHGKTTQRNNINNNEKRNINNNNKLRAFAAARASALRLLLTLLPPAHLPALRAAAARCFARAARATFCCWRQLCVCLLKACIISTIIISIANNTAKLSSA